MEPNDAASSSARAQEMRASLGTRREVEAMLAEASATREAAVADADAIIEEAQQVSDGLLRESRTEAERTTTDARLRAEGVVSRARADAEDITRQAREAADAVRARAEAQVEEHRRRVRAELTEQVTREVAEQNKRELTRVHERQQSMIGDIEASVRILGVSMEAAVANIAEMLGALDSLRAHTVESLADATVPMTARPRHAESSKDSADDSDGEDDDESDRPGGRTARSGHLIDALADLDGTPEPRAETRADRDVADTDLDELDEAELDELDELEDEDPPLTATEAFLRSSHIDHGDPPLPPMDDTEVGARYARDAMRATARSRTRRDAETLEVLPEREAVRRPRRNGKAGPDERVTQDEAEDDEAKPLGWLFRSS